MYSRPVIHILGLMASPTTSNNTATVLLTASGGCDSLVTLDLTIGIPIQEQMYKQPVILTLG